MSGAGQAVPANQPEALSTLTEAAERMQEAAHRAGVDRDTPLGVWVQTMAASMAAFGETAAEQRKAVQDTVQGTRKLAEAEVARLRELTAQAELTVMRANAACVVADVEKEKALGEVVDFLAPEIVKVLRDTVVVRELVHNKRLRLRQQIRAGALVVAVFLGGYVARTWQTWDATSALRRCQLSVVTDATSGRRYCAEEVLLDLPRAAAPTAR